MRQVQPSKGGILLDTALGSWLVVPSRPRAGRCSGEEFGVFDVRLRGPGARSSTGIAVTWPETALHAIDSEQGFRALIERVRDSIEPVELSCLFAIYRAQSEYGRAHNLVLGASEFERLRARARAAELASVEALGPLRSTRQPDGLALDFFTYSPDWIDEPFRRPATKLVRWHVVLSPSGGLDWRSSTVAMLPHARFETLYRKRTRR